MDISNLKEEELHLKAKKLLDDLRLQYVRRGDMNGIQFERKKFMQYFRSFEYPLDLAWHELRALDIAEAECQLTQMIKG